MQSRKEGRTQKATWMNRVQVELEIKKLFALYGASQSNIPSGVSGHVKGKVYELFVLVRVIDYLRSHGFNISFSHPHQNVKFKSSPGLLHQSDPHFIARHSVTQRAFDIFLDVEFITLGTEMLGAESSDNSFCHEIDIGVYEHGLDHQRPTHEDVALAVECKALAKLEKHVVRGILGLRRELSFLAESSPSTVAVAAGNGAPEVPAWPPSEVWLCCTDPRINNYKVSTGAFGIQCLYEVP